MRATLKKFLFLTFLLKKKFQKQNQFYFHFEKHFRFANVVSIKTFSFQKKIIFVSETLSLLFRKHFVNQIEKTLHQFFLRGPCVQPSVEGQCFHLRRLDLQILLRQCLAPGARDRIARTSQLDDCC